MKYSWEDLRYQSQPGEIWKPLFGYEKNHTISNHGRIRSFGHTMNKGLFENYNSKVNIRKPVLMKIQVHTGVCRIVIRKDHVPTCIQVAKAMLLSFEGPPTGFLETPWSSKVCYLDGDPLNTDLSNLRWKESK